MPRIGTVDERYQSYNVEMFEVTGGKFWKPYGTGVRCCADATAPSAAPSSGGDTPAGMNSALYEIALPIDLTKTSGCTRPAYVRVSGPSGFGAALAPGHAFHS
jgi:heparanase 1